MELRAAEPRGAVVLQSSQVISGSCDFDAAAAIAGHGLDEDPLELLSSLVDRSLVRSLEGDRFSMLDTLRSFAAEQLESSDRRGRPRAPEIGVDLVHQRRPRRGSESNGPLPGHWLRLRADSPNCVAALEWLTASDRTQEAAKLAGALAGFWVLEGQIARADTWLSLLRGVEVDDATAASVIRGVGVVEMYQGRFEDSSAACRQSVDRAKTRR